MEDMDMDGVMDMEEVIIMDMEDTDTEVMDMIILIPKVLNLRFLKMTFALTTMTSPSWMKPSG